MLVRELVGGSHDTREVRTADGELVRAAASDVPPAELVVVGDADQSIYAFRGATIRNIVEFERDYPNARTIMLEQNYRSTQNILSAANAVIARNPDRRAKNLWTAQGGGIQIVGYVGDNEHDEAQFVGKEIDALVDAGRRDLRRRRGLLPHQRGVPRAGGRVRPDRDAVPDRRRRAVLRAQGGQGRAGLPAGDRQSRRRGQPAAHPEHAAARHRRPGRGGGRARSPTESASDSARRCNGSGEITGLAARSANSLAVVRGTAGRSAGARSASAWSRPTC